MTNFLNISHRRIVYSVTVLSLLSLFCVLCMLYWSIAFVPYLSGVDNETDTLRSRSARVLQYASAVFHDKLPKSFAFSSIGHPDGVEDVAEAIRGRVRNVSRLCKQYHLGKYKWDNNSNDLNLKEPPTPLFSYFFWNRERHLAWCPVYKAGSTSWLQNMMRLAGYSETMIQNPPKQLSIWAREVYGDSDNFEQDEVKRALKLLVVRHPFERLMSAYRDKLSNSTVGHEHGSHHFYIKYGKQIVRKFRKDHSLQQVEPTWEEFVRYIIKTDLIQYADDHWLPAYYSCTPCLVDYDVIAKTETYFRDQKYIIKLAGLEEVLKPRWSHSTADKEAQSRLQLRRQYFSQLTKSQVKQLYEKYKLDFLLFGYDEDYKDYLKLAKEK